MKVRQKSNGQIFVNEKGMFNIYVFFAGQEYNISEMVYKHKPDLFEVIEEVKQVEEIKQMEEVKQVEEIKQVEEVKQETPKDEPIERQSQEYSSETIEASPTDEIVVDDSVSEEKEQTQQEEPLSKSTSKRKKSK